MQDAQTYLEIVRSRGERKLELRRVYHNLQNRELFLRAYAKLYANDGALTPGIEPDNTADNMSLKRIDHILDRLKAGTYHWQAVRRVYVPKKAGSLRPLGVPTWDDKLLQEVLRMVLSAYYEPQFSDASHGFRPGRGCHTALRTIRYGWTGTKWFIEGDIQGCFDHIDHQRLLAVIGQSIKDERLLKLLRGMLDAGYLEDWKYHRTYSGTPQGGVISPLLANIFLHQLDQYIENELIPQHTRGLERKPNPEYRALAAAKQQAKARKEVERYQALKQELRTLPSGDPNDPEYRRLKYVRYADDFLLGYVGPKSEALRIKQRLGEFLTRLGLTLSEEKTVITHATHQRARFLGYDILMAHSDCQIRDGRRSVNGRPLLSVPPEIPKEWMRRRTHGGKPYHRTELINHSDYDIVTAYQLEFQGLVNYYVLAYDVAAKLYPVKWVYLQSLVKTLAVKHKRPATWVYRHYSRRVGQGRKAIVVTVPREGQAPLIARFGAKPIRHDKWAVSQDTQTRLLPSRNELVKRLLANQCELCGATDEICVHHIRKLKDLKRRYAGRPEPPHWVIRMIQLRRKTLVVCAACHQRIHAGTYDGPKLN